MQFGEMTIYYLILSFNLIIFIFLIRIFLDYYGTFVGSTTNSLSNFRHFCRKEKLLKKTVQPLPIYIILAGIKWLQSFFWDPALILRVSFAEKLISAPLKCLWKIFYLCLFNHLFLCFMQFSFNIALNISLSKESID